jgi:hypothetical protein
MKRWDATNYMLHESDISGGSIHFCISFFLSCVRKFVIAGGSFQLRGISLISCADLKNHVHSWVYEAWPGIYFMLFNFSILRMILNCFRTQGSKLLNSQVCIHCLNVSSSFSSCQENWKWHFRKGIILRYVYEMLKVYDGSCSPCRTFQIQSHMFVPDSMQWYIT